MKPTERGTLGEDERALEALLLDEEFATLSAFQPFNLFEALGMVRAEIRHSRFLAHLLDPSASHDLGEGFLRDFCVLACRSHASFRVADVMLADFDQALVQCEHLGIDILISDSTNRLVVAIENKVGAAEHGDQLRRYRDAVKQAFPGWHQVFVFLTAEGDAASEDEYEPVSYVELLPLVQRHASRAARADIQLALGHYAELIRTHIVTDEQTIRLCRRIYQRHRRAIELINEYGVQRREVAMADILEAVVVELEKTLPIAFDSRATRVVRFAVPAWDSLPWMKSGTWTTSQRAVMFEIHVKDEVALVLQLGTGDARVRESVYAELRKAGHSRQKLTPFWHWASKHVLVNKRELAEFDPADEGGTGSLRSRLAESLERYLRAEIPKFSTILGTVTTPVEGHERTSN